MKLILMMSAVACLIEIPLNSMNSRLNSTLAVTVVEKNSQHLAAVNKKDTPDAELLSQTDSPKLRSFLSEAASLLRNGLHETKRTLQALLESRLHPDSQEEEARNVQRDEKLFPLHAALQKDSLTSDELMRVINLISRSNDLNVRNKEGDTPLLVAVRKRNFDAALMLLIKGARVDLTDKQGKTALQIACERGDFRCITLLIAEGASLNKRDDQE